MTTILTNDGVTEGNTIQPFTAKIQTGDTLSSKTILQDFDYILLVFYPGDDTPGCTKQLCGIRDIYKEYLDLGVKVLGVNHGNAESHQKFIDKYNYKFDIIVDEEKLMRKLFGAEKKFFKNIITKRGVFLINKEHNVVYQQWGQQDNQKIIDMIKDSQ
jgi:thioredoxin-dependent peroxiredoxin